MYDARSMVSCGPVSFAAVAADAEPVFALTRGEGSEYVLRVPALETRLYAADVKQLVQAFAAVCPGINVEIAFG